MDEILTAVAPEEQAEQEEILIATVGAVTETGVTLIFAGEESASEKTYQGNVSAALKAGDRVKITKDSGTYLIDYAVGVPGSAVGEDTHELPAGGATGQALVKKSSADGDVEWDTISLTGGLPTGGTDGQLLAKNGKADYSGQWVDNPIPTGGSDGQVLMKDGTTARKLKFGSPSGGLPAGGTDGQLLAKNGKADYSGQWVDNPIPTGGSDGQVLMKDGTTARKLKFGAPSAGQLVAGAHKVTLSTAGVLAGGSSKDISLGSSSYPFKDVYADGTIALAQGYSGSVLKLGGSNATIGFFGVTPVRRPTVSASATVAQVITALKSLGLFQ